MIIEFKKHDYMKVSVNCPWLNDNLWFPLLRSVEFSNLHSVISDVRENTESPIGYFVEDMIKNPINVSIKERLI